MKNAKESLYIIPNECIVNGEIKNDLTMDDISSFQLKIYKYKNINGKSEINRLFNLIRPRQQIISQITYSERNSDGSNKVRQRRWIITSNPNIYNEGNENCYKMFKVEEFQSILKGKRLKFYQDNVIQLWNKEKEEGKEGILDNFEEQTGWKIDYVDENARYETIKAMDTIEKVLQTNYINNKVTTGGLLFSFNINTNLPEGEDIYFQFDYKNGVVSNSLGKVMEGYDKSNSFGNEPVNSNIIKIDGYHYSIAGNRYGIKYILTLKNGDIIERYADFYNCADNKLTIDEIKFTYETGKEIEKTSKKFINIDSDVDDTWWNYLNTIQDKFNCLFVFNSYTRTMSCISRNSLNTEGKYSFNFNKNLISYETESEDSTFINGLKVTSSNEDVSIVSQNYFGDDTIYDYSYYVKNNLMSDELINKWKEYETILIDYQNQWNVLQDLLSVCKQQKLRTDNEITTLSSQEDVLMSLLNNYQNNNDTTNQARIKSELDEVTNRRNKCVQLSNSLDNSIKEYSNKIAILNEKSKPKNVTSRGEKIFTDDNIQELNDITYIEELQDDYFTESYSLYKYSIEYLKNKLIPTTTFKCNIVNLAKLLEQDWKKIMVLGYKYRFEDLDEKTIEDLGGSNLLIFKSYTFNINKRQVKDLIFVNKLQNSKDINKNIVAGIRKKQDRIINTLTNYNTTTNNAKSSYNFVQETYKNGINLSNIKLISETNDNITRIGQDGYMVKDANDPNKAILMTGGKIYATENGWESSAKFMDSNRVVGEAIKGQILLGSNLCISQVTQGDSVGQFYVGNLNDEHNADDNGKNFALQIKDSNSVERIFIGLIYKEELDSYEILFALKDADGNSTLSADEQGKLTISGDFVQYTKDGVKSVEIRNNRITFFNWNQNGQEVGSLGSTVGSKNKVPYIELYHKIISALAFGYEIETEDESANIFPYCRFDKNLLSNKYPIEFFENIGIKATLNLFKDIYLNGWSMYLSDKYPDLNFSTSKNGKMGVYGGNGFYSEKGISTGGDFSCEKITATSLEVSGDKNCIQKTDYGNIPFYANEDIISLLTITPIDKEFETKYDENSSKRNNIDTYSCLIDVNKLEDKNIINQCINLQSNYNVYIFQLNNDNGFAKYNYKIFNNYIKVFSDKPMKFKIKLEGKRVGFEDRNLSKIEEKKNKRINRKIIDKESTIASKEWKEYGRCLDY